MSFENAARLALLYAGRTDLWGAEHGEQIKRPLTPYDWEAHVYGQGSVGVYPLVQARDDGDVPIDKWYVKWFGVDIDEGDDISIVIARNLQKASRQLGLLSFIEISKSKGCHLLLFAQDWVPAVDARKAMQVVCQVVDYTPKEIYPKQTELADGQAGNYLNAAYSRKWVEHGRRVVLGPQSGKPFPLHLFLDAAEASLNEPWRVTAAAELYKQPPPPKPVVWTLRDPFRDREPRGVAAKMIEEGPFPSVHTGRVDRSAALVRMANLLHDDNFTPAEALYWVQFFDGRPDMLKYVGRRDADDRYREIVERAFS